jgi:hypothetical protein
MLNEFWSACAAIYPDVAALGDRMLPTYAHHAARRAEEMRQLERTALASSQDATVISAVRAAHEALAGLHLGQKSPPPPPPPASGSPAAAFIERLATAVSPSTKEEGERHGQ